MFSLVYESKASPTCRLLQVREILAKSRKFNQENDITGCLLLYERRFLQYLEGNQLKILELYDRIKSDSRHSSVTLLYHDNIEVREFETWDMAFGNLDGYNFQLQYLNLLVGIFFDDNENSYGLNPTSEKFWKTTRMVLCPKRKPNPL